MNKTELNSFHEDQMSIVLKNREKLKQQGYVKSYKDVYPDVYKNISSNKAIAYVRGNVSIKIMALLYDNVIVYIPPLPKSSLEKRFSISWEELIILCQQRIVIPIIGNATYYTAKHFDTLFKDLLETPYSLWARGIALLDVFDMSDTLNFASANLPVKDIANDNEVLKKWAQKYTNSKHAYVKKKIIEDVAVKYADLCIFGCKAEADSLIELNYNDLYTTLNRLNEIRTYPILFGLESQANFESSKLSELSTPTLKTQYSIPQSLPDNELEILYRGIGIEIDKISVNEIINYHSTSLGKTLRSALNEFNNYCDTKISKKETMDYSQVYQRAESFQKNLNEAVKDLIDNNYYSKLDSRKERISDTLRIGAVIAGGLIVTGPNSNNPLSVTSIIGKGFSYTSALSDKIANVLVKFEEENLHSKFVANMWSAKGIVEKHEKK